MSDARETVARRKLRGFSPSARLLIAGALGGMDQLVRAEREGWVPPHGVRADVDTLTRGEIVPADWETPS